jgi:hypothetical protein
MERPADTPDERRTGRHPYARYTIIRSPDTGVRVLRLEEYGGHPGVQPLGTAGIPQIRPGELRLS